MIRHSYVVVIYSTLFSQNSPLSTLNVIASVVVILIANPQQHLIDPHLRIDPLTTLSTSFHSKVAICVSAPARHLPSNQMSNSHSKSARFFRHYIAALKLIITSLLKSLF